MSQQCNVRKILWNSLCSLIINWFGSNVGKRIWNSFKVQIGVSKLADKKLAMKAFKYNVIDKDGVGILIRDKSSLKYLFPIDRSKC